MKSKQFGVFEQKQLMLDNIYKSQESISTFKTSTSTSTYRSLFSFEFACYKF